MRSTLLVLLVAMSMFPLTNLMFTPAAGSNIIIETTRFNNGKTDATVEFLGGGVDDTLGLSVQTGVYIDEVRMKLSSVAQPAGSKDYPANVLVDFGGDSVLEWAWKGPGYGPLGRQNLFVNNQPVMNASTPTGGGYNDSVAFRLPKTAVVKSATMSLSAGTTIGTQGKILVLNADYNGYGFDTDPVNRLKAFTSDFSVVDRFDGYSKTPAWDDIKDYSAILACNNYMYGYGFQNPTALGDLLADYVDAGGSLTCAFSTFYNGYGTFALTGRFGTGGYYALPPSSSTVWSYYNALGIKKEIPNHPLLSNVSDINTNSNYYQYFYRSGSTPDPAATLVASWIDGYPLALTKTVGGVDRVDINLWPVSSQTSGPYGAYAYYTYTNDGDDLMKNALLFGGRKPISATADLLKDSVLEFNRTGFTGNYTLPDFSGMVNSYLATAGVSYEDKYGNQFVDIPINVTTVNGGRLAFGNLAITYDYSTSIDANPANGNLTLAVSDLQSTVVGEQNNTIPIYISSSSSGKLKLHDFYVRMSPPNHAPRVDSFFPAIKTEVQESSSLEFGVNATDIYKNPMTYAWFHNGVQVPFAGAGRLTLDFGYDDAGNHTVVAKVANAISEKTYTNLTWHLSVLDVNRPPQITSFLPAGDVSVAENATQLFEVVTSDPDTGDTQSYEWFLDGQKVADATGANYSYAPGFFDSGPHSVKVVVTDLRGATDSEIWPITVVDVNVEPFITGWAPRGDMSILETQSLEFSITASDPDKADHLTISWSVDDAVAFVGNPFTFETDYRSAGVHRVTASATDGDATATHTWTVTVDDVNRLPQAAIDSPRDQSEYMEGQAIKFSARSATDPDNETLSFSWKEGGVNVSDQMEFERAFPPGIHTLTLEVRDKSGGKASATVRFRVRYVEISVSVGMDRLEAQAGSKVEIVLTMTNVGDTNATDVSVDVQVDGVSIGTTTIQDMRPGGVEKVLYQWKATKGPHTITAKVGDKTWTKQVSVAAAPAPPPASGISDYIWPIVLVVIAVGLSAFGAMVLRKR